MDQLQLPAACRFLEIWDLGACMFCTTLLSTGLAPNPTRRRAFFFFSFFTNHALLDHLVLSLVFGFSNFLHLGSHHHHYPGNGYDALRLKRLNLASSVRIGNTPHQAWYSGSVEHTLA